MVVHAIVDIIDTEESTEFFSIADILQISYYNTVLLLKTVI